MNLNIWEHNFFKSQNCWKKIEVLKCDYRIEKVTEAPNNPTDTDLCILDTLDLDKGTKFKYRCGGYMPS